jgi:hypothetical protein
VDAESTGLATDGPIYQQTMELINREARKQLDHMVDRFWAHRISVRPAIVLGALAVQLLKLEASVTAKGLERPRRELSNGLAGKK